MTAHAIVIETRLMLVLEHRWVCCCTSAGGWKPGIRHARTGGQRHVAAMERGRDQFAVLRQPGKGGARTTEGREREIAKHERRAAIARGVMRRGER